LLTATDRKQTYATLFKQQGLDFRHKVSVGQLYTHCLGNTHDCWVRPNLPTQHDYKVTYVKIR